MALVVADRVKETTTSTGTGAITLGGAESNFRTFSSVLSDADTTYYAIIDDNNVAFEVGLGTYASSGNTITRTTVLASSNSNNAVNFSAGTKDVFLTYPADKSVNRDASGNVSVSGGVTATSFTGPVTATQVDLTGQGDLRLQDSSGGEYVALQAASTLGSSYTLTLPTSDGSADQVLQTDGSGVLSWVTHGITHLDTWRITSNITSDAVPITTWSNSAAYPNLQPTLGTAMSLSSGLFTFPVTGYWEVQFFGQYYNTGSDNMGIGIQAYEADGTLRSVSVAAVGETASYYNQINLTSYLNITNVSTQKVRFFANSVVDARLEGATDRDKTYVVFKRIAGSV